MTASDTTLFGENEPIHPDLRPRVAILDLYDHVANVGMRCIKDILTAMGLDYQVFDCRGNNEFPKPDDFHIYISTGGPGNPHDCIDTEWGRNYFALIDHLWEHNAQGNGTPKYVFFICHSIQMITIHWKLADVVRRRSTSFGIFPTHKTDSGRRERYFANLRDPFYVVDSRDFQIIQPKTRAMRERGVEILAIEKFRPHIVLERAIMAMRFSPQMIGTQFHPEADLSSVKHHFNLPERRDLLIKNHGIKKLHEMEHLAYLPETITHTHHSILPSFLREAVQAVLEFNAVLEGQL